MDQRTQDIKETLKQAYLILGEVEKNPDQIAALTLTTVRENGQSMMTMGGEVNCILSSLSQAQFLRMKMLHANTVSSPQTESGAV